MPLKVIFFGSPQFAVPSLQALHDAGHQVVAAVCQPDAPKGRGQKLMPPDVKVAAERLGIPVLQPTRIKGEAGAAFLEEVKRLQPDVGVVAAYGKILPQALLDAPRAGCVNLHASLLPRFRGASPIHHAILEGDAKTGVCLMRMVLELDAGGVFARTETDILTTDTSETLTARLADMAARLCVEKLPGVVDGSLTNVPQGTEGLVYAPLLQKEMGRLCWSGDAAREERRVRAMTPWPGTFTQWKGEPLKVHAVELVDGTTLNATPGAITAVGKEHVDVACGRGVLRLLEVQPPNKKRMGAGEFARGARLSVGDVFLER